MTVLEIIQRSTDYLSRKGVASARLQAELLLAHVMQEPRLRLYLNFQQELPPDKVNAMRDLVVQRGSRAPLQHLVGTVSFCGLELAVGPAALIPRPETELLAEVGYQFLLERAANTAGPVRALDLGTGTGCLAVAVALRCPNATIVAVDISLTALELARRNVAAHQVQDRVTLLAADGLSALARAPSFDLILSNPPYIARRDIATLEPEVRDHDPHLALDGGEDGLDYYRRWATEAGTRLLPHGRMMLELGDGQAAEVASCLAAHNWIVDSVMPDYTARDRVLIARQARDATV